MAKNINPIYQLSSFKLKNWGHSNIVHMTFDDIVTIVQFILILSIYFTNNDKKECILMIENIINQ